MTVPIRLRQLRSFSVSLPFTLSFLLCLFFPVTSYAEDQADLAKYAPFVSTSDKGMVVTAGEQASDAGIAMLRQGGNAVDAAVAASFVIARISVPS